MPRWKLTLEFDGRPFVGWQRQDNGPSVQQALEEAILHFCGEEVRVFTAGRTDAGVHALGLVCHVDISRETTSETVRDALNFHLRPQPVAVLTAEPTAVTFHARLSAIRRHYVYRILNRRAPLTLDRGRAWHMIRPLDDRAMHAAAQRLLGKHDFSTFRASLCQAKSPVKTLDRLDITREDDEIRIWASARSFLHHQVRNMVGTLERVGTGRWSADDLQTALQARNRAAGGATAPPDGLYFLRAEY